MKYLVLSAALLVSPVFGHEHHPSVPSKVFATYKVPKVTDRSPAAQAKAANDFLALLDEEMKKKTLFALDSKERSKWTNLPPRGNELGARLGDLNEKQIEAALRLMATVLSDKGFHMAWSIPLADDKLLPKGKRRPGFGAEDYWLVLFAPPSADKPWALQFDGHHLAFNVAIHGEKMALTPSFIGTQPYAFKMGEKEIKPIQPFADKAHLLINALPEEIRKIAIVSEKRGHIKTAAGKDGVIPKIKGASASSFAQKQKDQLLELMAEYVNCLPEHAAKPRIEQLKKDLDRTHFAWSGPTPEKSDMSYIIQGPSVIIEYACQSLGGDPLNHIHAMYRDPSNEYGKNFMK